MEVELDLSFVSKETDFRHDFHNEKHVVESFLDDIRTDDVIYDVGANIGIYSTFAGKYLDSGSVLAFEPQPAAVPFLHQNLSRNCDQFKVVQLALSSRSAVGKVPIDFDTGANTKTDSGVYVKMDPVEDFIELDDIPTPTVAKVDVEGAELDVLRGFGDILAELELAYVEIHHQRGEKFGSSKGAVLDVLESNFEEVIELEEHERGGGTQTHVKTSSR